ncbi:MAG: hypothetical protein OEV30_04510 [Ignavibacteria bacterium]|nr:hypothetical protein [Ignavibacteria bacterium]
MTYPTLLAVLLMAVSVQPQGTAQEIDSPMKLLATMTKYNVGVIWKGPKWTDQSESMINKRIEETSHEWKKSIADGKLVGAIRVADPKDLWGLLFFKTDNKYEMETIAMNALSVQEGALDGTIVTVWGTKGLGRGLAKSLKEDPDAELSREEHYMAIYRKGKKWSDKADDPATREATSEGIKYLYELHRNGDLLYYAALEDYSRDARGVAVLKAGSRGEAYKLASAGPMVGKDWLTVEIKRVYIVGGILP